MPDQQSTSRRRDLVDRLRDPDEQQDPQLCRDAADELARLRADHDRRVTELLEANNREVERRRRAEADLAMAVARIEDMLMGDDGQAWQEARKFLRDLERREVR